MKRIKKIIHKVAALCLSLFLALGLIAPAFSINVHAEAVEVLESSATIADCVMSYYAMTGSAVANTEWINSLYNSLGSEFGTLAEFANDGLMFFEDGVWKPAEQLAQNIANTEAYTELGLNTVFNVSAEEAANGGGLAAATGAATLSGAAGCVATYGILPVLGGVTAAYWGGIAVGTLIAHKLGLYDQNIYMGAEMDFNTLKENIPSGSRCCFIKQRNSNNNNIYMRYVFCDGISFSYVSGNTLYYGMCSNTSNDIPMYRFSYNLNTGNTSDILSLNTNILKRSTDINNVLQHNIQNRFDSESAFNAALQKWRNGTEEPIMPTSPDLIGLNGNLKGNYENGNYTVPDMLPQIDPSIQSGKPLSLNDWLAFANGVQNNNIGTSPLPNNTTLFQDILDAIRSTIPGGGNQPDPGPGEDPGTVPVPTPNPDPDYDVDQPDTNASESETPETDPDLNPPDFVLPNLMEKFPFCIPNDIATIFGKFRNQTRQAPYISWRFNPPGTPIDYTFDLNLSEFEEVAALLRTLELIAFVVGLAYATRYLIGSS